MCEESFWNPLLTTLLGEHTIPTLVLQFAPFSKTTPANYLLCYVLALDEIIRGQKGLPAVSYMNVQPNFIGLCRLAEAKFLVTPKLSTPTLDRASIVILPFD